MSQSGQVLLWIIVFVTDQTPEMHHWSTPQKMLKKSCVFTKFFHSFFLLKNTLIIYNLFKFYFLKKSFLFCVKRILKVNLDAAFLYHCYTKQILQFYITYTWPKIGEIGEVLHFNTIFMCVKQWENINIILYKIV